MPHNKNAAVLKAGLQKRREYKTPHYKNAAQLL
jgi:hypothetical protein